MKEGGRVASERGHVVEMGTKSLQGVGKGIFLDLDGDYMGMSPL